MAPLLMAASDVSYQNEIRPLVRQYCLGCHSAAMHTGDVNLERFASYEDVLKDPRVWQKVVEQVSIGEMPPRTMPQPGVEQRTRMLEWVNGALAVAARAHAGDPGPVVLRRLNNAEYTFTIRDLTGVVSLDPAKEFPADGAAGEGFMNTGNALAMSPSLLTKYLDAGKGIAAHAVLLPDGIRFSPATSRRDWTDEALREIRTFYRQYTEEGGAETVTQQGIALDKNRGGSLPLRRYLNASLALRGVGGPAAEKAAKQGGLSGKYLGLLVDLLKSGRPSPLMDGLRKKWQAGDVEGMVGEIGKWQSTLWKFSSVGHIGKVGGPKAWMEPVDPVVEEQEFRVKLGAPASGNEVKVYLVARDAGDGRAGDIAVWREPKIAVRGRKPVLLRDVRGLVEDLTAWRGRVFAEAQTALLAADGRSIPGAGDPETRKAWFDFLGIGVREGYKLDWMTKKVEKSGAYDFVQGWGSGDLPTLLANSSGQGVRVPGTMKAHGVAVHPSKTAKAGIGWQSPVVGTLRVEGTITRAHAECGAGVTYTVELRRGATRRQLAVGEARGKTAVAFGPFERVRVQPGDLLSVLIGPRDGNHSCALTDVELRLSGGAQSWSLTEDVSGNVLAGNPHADRNGHERVWHFYQEPVEGDSNDTVIAEGSLLARWLDEERVEERRRLAEELGRLLNSGPPSDGSPDAALYKQLSLLSGPLFAGARRQGDSGGKWGLDPAMFGKRPDGTAIDGASLCVRAPAAVEVSLPADLVAGSEFVTTGALDKVSGAEGSVQLEVLTAKPEERAGLLPTGTMIRDSKGLWSSNNQVVDYAMPVVVNKGSAARKRVEGWFEEFRQMFPAALCYTKIVPVDEVVTLTLFHREDDHLSRLILNAKEKAKLDRLWDELHYLSRDALTLVDAFEQLWQYATQDADPSAFEPLRKPIQMRAAAFRQRLAETEPRHIEGVLEFADRAYRRRLTEGEKGQLRGLYSQLREQGLGHEDAVRLMLARVLVTPAFLYRAENAPAGKEPRPVSSRELGSRLSYFLWSSMPDGELRAAADSGALRTPAVLQAQARRMLRDSRVSRMGSEFGAAWLHLYGFDSLDEKSERHFPEFRELRGAMYEETIRFFTDFFQNNGSIPGLLNADYTFVNEALAKHYGIPGVSGAEWRRVDGIGRYGRGGVIGQAAVLAKESGASRTSPILRGNWILEVLLGEKLPRPPKDVPQLPADEATESMTVRELTEKHSTDRRCSGCHSRSDPYGFTLERFDAIGRYRDRDLGNRPINDRAKFKDGGEAEGLEGLRKYLLSQRRDAFVHQFLKKLLGYALGRAVQLSDEPLLGEMQARLAGSGYHVGTAIEMIVASPQFQNIRGRDYEPDRE